MVNKIINPKKIVGSRLKANKVKIQQLKNSQFVLTIPKALADSFDLKKGTVVKFKINEKGRLEIIKDEEQE